MAEANHPEDKVRHLQVQLYLAAKRSPQRRFHALYDRIARRDVLMHAWEQVRSNRGGAGIDGQTIAEVEAYGVERMLEELREQLEAHRYRPQPVRRVYIPKEDGRSRRPLGIPGVRDRVLQAATRLVLEPLFEASFKTFSYGFRPKRSAHQAVDVVREQIEAGYQWVVEVDIRAFFDNVNHELLLGLVGRRVSDRRVLKLIRQWLRAGVMEEGRLSPTEAGVPQGGVISPLLANVYLHALDALWEAEAANLGQMVRYADDLVVLCRTEADAQAAYRWVLGTLKGLKLEDHPDKTRVIDVSDGSRGFDFLGFHFRRTPMVRKPKRLATKTWPSRRAKKSIRAKIKVVTSPRSKLALPVEEIVKELNPILRGWSAYCVSRGRAPEEMKEVRPTIRMAQPTSSSLPAGASPVQVIARVPGSRLAVSGGNAWRRSPASKASLEGATERSAASKRSLPRRKTNPKGTRGSRARSIRAKAMEGVKNLEVQRRGTPRRNGRGTFGRWWRELERPSPAPGTAAREQPVRITAKREVAPSRKGVGWGHT